MDDGQFSGGFSLTGKELSNAPKFTFSGTVNYRLPLANDDDINFRWNSNYRSHYWFDSTNDPYIQQNGYYGGNARLPLLPLTMEMKTEIEALMSKIKS